MAPAKREQDWAAWSREAGRLMQRRNEAWKAKFGLTNEPYHWDLDDATIRFTRSNDEVVASLCLVGTTSEHDGTFLWAWANEIIPPAAIQRLGVVREFGDKNDLPLLTEPEHRGSRPEGLEIVAIAGRILDAEGVFIDRAGDVTFFFALMSFHVEPNT